MLNPTVRRGVGRGNTRAVRNLPKVGFHPIAPKSLMAYYWLVAFVRVAVKPLFRSTLLAETPFTAN
jgi:hypothetical protein